jgi:deoxyribonuclease-4
MRLPWYTWKDAMPLFGAHMSSAGGHHNALIEAKARGCSSVQLFTKAPSQWSAKPIDPEQARLFRRTLRESGLSLPMAHDSYLINLASPDMTLCMRSVDALADEMDRAELLGLRYLVMHPGASLDDSEDSALKRIARSLDEIHLRCPDHRVRLLLETTAGQGSTLGHRFEHLAAILTQVRHPKRLGVCFDTCHVFAAGYPLSPESEYEKTMQEFDRIVGLKRIMAFHVNDSKKPCGSRVDRHAHIGRGEIGLEAFRRLVNDPRFADRPMILETPKEQTDEGHMDDVNLRTLRELMQTP